MNFANPKRYKVLTACLVVGYGLVALDILLRLSNLTWALINGAVCLLFLLGIHWYKSKGCAVGLLIRNVIAMSLHFIRSGVLCGWLGTVISIAMVWTFRKIDEEYVEYKNSFSNRYDPYKGYYRHS